MKIQFNKKDKELFFSMLSVYKIYGEIAEKLQKEDMELPYSTVDLLIDKIAAIISRNNLYENSMEIDENKLIAILRFMLGTGVWKFDSSNDFWIAFSGESPVGSSLVILKDKLFEFLLKNGLEI
jgi:hypothetical protein